MLSRFAIVAVVAGLLGCAATGSAAVAMADPVDDSFISYLNESEIPVPPRDEAISLAHSVCQVISDGIDPTGAAAATSDSTGMDMHQASVFVHHSVLSYCPQYAGLVDGASPTVSNGKTYTVTTLSIDGDTPEGNGGEWHGQVSQLSGGDPAVTDAFNAASESVAHRQIDEARTDNAKYPSKWAFESASTVTFSNIAIGQLIAATNYAGPYPAVSYDTVVIDSRTAQPITLSDLFVNEQDGLDRLSQQARTIGLKSNDGITVVEPTEAGIAPTPENFGAWLPTEQGMQINFPHRHFGGGSLPATVTVPWPTLADLLAPNMAALA